MRFLVDESTDARLAAYLNSLGHEATLVARARRPGLPDLQVLEIAHEEGRILVTDDRDFGEIVESHEVGSHVMRTRSNENGSSVTDGGSLDEIVASEDVFAPRDLASLIQPLLRNEYPQEPSKLESEQFSDA